MPTSGAYWDMSGGDRFNFLIEAGRALLQGEELNPDEYSGHEKTRFLVKKALEFCAKVCKYYAKPCNLYHIEHIGAASSRAVTEYQAEGKLGLLVATSNFEVIKPAKYRPIRERR